jgi:hypothetical protein
MAPAFASTASPEDPGGLVPLGQRTARIDHRHRSAGPDEAAFGIVGAARGDRLPTCAFGDAGQFVAMTE